MKPSDIAAVNRRLKQEYAKRRAPVIELIRAQTDDPFRILVATILSARTRDECTATVARRLFAAAGSPEALECLSVAELEKLIFPIGFFRTKARHLKRLPAAIREHFAGRIPDTVEELCELPGVGRKTANLVVSVAFDRPAVCVDVHVHRISNRLGLVKTGTPAETERALRNILPVCYWKTWNRYLVSYGQTVCKPTRPACGECRIRRYCSRIGLLSTAAVHTRALTPAGD